MLLLLMLCCFVVVGGFGVDRGVGAAVVVVVVDLGSGCFGVGGVSSVVFGIDRHGGLVVGWSVGVGWLVLF